jgi:putative toxin-antitoxin system antitoxin component (TIGR02293 family)
VAKNLPLNKNLSERILRLQEIMYLAQCYFGQDETAMRWFQDVNKGLDDKKPFTVCDTFYGMERVENSLMKLVHGMTA